jgi:hypothetical protein
MCVVFTMNRNPPDRIALERERSENSQQILERLAESQAPVGERTVETERNSQGDGAVEDDARCRQTGPGKTPGQSTPSAPT